MEVKIEEDKTIKTIVPIKGNLLEKLKSKLHQNNKIPNEGHEMNDTLNNNHNRPTSSTNMTERKVPDKKVIIQRYEKVNLDVTKILRVDPIDTNTAESIDQEKSSVKILSAKMPENCFNKTVPLKMTRIIRPPKPAPNFQRPRFGSVQVHQTPAIPVIIPTEPQVESFKGFSDEEKHEPINEKLKLWQKCLQMDNESLNKLKLSTLDLPSTSESQIITDSMVNSSMMREFANDLESTADDMSSMDDTEDDDMETSSDDIEMDADQAQWLMDIDDLIGEQRIREIDQSLKKIPSIVTGNKIQTENVELKLIINHLLKKLNAQTVVETMSTLDATTFSHQPVKVEINATTIQEPEIDINEHIENNETPKEAKTEAARKRKNELHPLATSTVKKMKPGPIYDLIDTNCEQPSTSAAKVDSKSVIARGRKPRLKAEEEEEKEKSVVEESLPIEAEAVKRGRGRPKLKSGEKEPTRRNSKLVSGSDVVSEKSLCKTELISNDLNSTDTSVIIYQDYPSSSSIDKRSVVEKSSNVIIEEAENVVEIQKSSDPTFRKPQQPEKRPYLKTSAFKGNIKQESDSDDSAEDSCSVSNDPLPLPVEPSPKRGNNSQQNNLNLKQIMHSLIEGQKTIIEKSAKKLPVNVPRKKVKKKSKPNSDTRRRKLDDFISHPKKAFEQEPLEDANENKVPYNAIMECIRQSNPPRGKDSGKAVWKGRDISVEEAESLREKLTTIKHFRCGSCQLLVTKHKWKQHLESHGVFAYIDEFEKPLNISDWNESFRRIIQYCRIFKIDTLVCPNCNSIRRSPLGQLTHIYVCGEDAETVEMRKIQCEFCELKVLPYNMSMHKKVCIGLQVVNNEEIESSGSESEEIINSSGRRKRKAVQKAEKNFKNILNTLSEDQVELIGTSNESAHNIHQDGEDFGNSSSDNYGGKSDASSETEEESSGVDENECQCAESNDDENNSNIVSFHAKGKAPNYEQEETKYSRKLVHDYVENIRHISLSSRLIELNQELIGVHLDDEIFPNLSAKYTMSSLDLRSFLNQWKLKQKSVHYASNQVDYYLKNFEESKVTSDWKQVDVGERDLNDIHHVLFFTGGSVSSMDWAPTNDCKQNFLAVAVNSNDIPMKFGLIQSSKSCVQIYEFKSLVNEKFTNFKNITSNLLYTFGINDGPIWCIKFHPCGHPSKERIGVLAVTTAQKDVLIFSLPSLNSNNKSVVNLEPSYVCRLAEEAIFYQDKFLMQATRICWYYQNGSVNTLAVGYVNGYIALMNFEGKVNKEAVKYPDLVIQAHREMISAVDMKAGKEGQILLLTASTAREIKMFSIESGRYEEISFSQSPSRTLCAQFWIHWPAFVNGNDSSYALGILASRQPFEFATKNTALINTSSTIIAMDINHWTNTAICSTDAGDVVTATPHQLISINPKNRWQAFDTTILSFTDFKNIPPDEIGIVFADMKTNGNKKPKVFREPPAELNNQLQINHICFNRNEKSHRFYAMGYETGFIRVRFMKHPSK